MAGTMTTDGAEYDGAVAEVQGEGMPPVLPPRIGSGSFWRFIHDRNPFYLLSAVCMFAGYRMILGAMNTPPGDVGGLVPLIAVLNLYEFVLIGLALFLIRRRGLIRDGWFLLIIQAMFMVDLTNLQSEVFTASLPKGLALNAACYALALFKVALVLRVLRLRVSIGEWGLIAAGLMVLFGMAGAFKGLAREGVLDARVLHAGWWVAGALAAAWAMTARGERFGRLAGVPVRLYMLIPFASLLIHLCGANRVYAMDFHAANVAPVLLGLAVALGAIRALPRVMAANAQMALIVLAGILSLAPGELSFSVAGVWLSPMRLTLLAAGAVAIWAFLRHHRWAFVCVAATCGLTASLGHTPEHPRETLRLMAGYLSDAFKAMIPTTAMGWGVLAVVASFVLLGVGAVVSLRKGVEMKDER